MTDLDDKLRRMRGKGQARSDFLAHLDFIGKSIAAGHPKKAIWQVLHDESRFRASYQQFVEYVGRFLESAQRRPTKPLAPPVPAGLHDESHLARHPAPSESGPEEPSRHIAKQPKHADGQSEATPVVDPQPLSATRPGGKVAEPALESGRQSPQPVNRREPAKAAEIGPPVGEPTEVQEFELSRRFWFIPAGVRASAG
jgi:hypothetical protein